ncbi:MAG: NAD-dependent epimerase/dehydratase family protein [Vampirovibrionales bacterium]
MNVSSQPPTYPIIEPCLWVTGATGFVGQCLVPYWLALGWKVVCLVRSTDSVQAKHLLHKGAVLVELPSVSEMLLKTLQESLTQYQPDGFVHLATHFVGEHRTEDIPALIESNLLLGTLCMEAWSHYTKAQNHGLHPTSEAPEPFRGWVLNTGTVWQHYQDQDYAPVNLYAATKQAFEAILQYYGEVQNLPILTLKLYDTYGPHDTRRKVIPLLRQAATTPLTQRPPVKLTEGTQQRFHFLHEEDLCRAFTHAITHMLPSLRSGMHCYALPSQQAVTLKEVVACFNELLPAQEALCPEWGVFPYRTREVFIPPSNTMLPPLPGWHASYSLPEGIATLLSNASHHSPQVQHPHLTS